jgi:hypothetical protein
MIAHFFALKPVDLRAARSRYEESLRLGAALRLGFLTMRGRPLTNVARSGVFRDHLLAATRSAPGSSNCRRSMVGDRSSLTRAPATRMDLNWPKLMIRRGQSDSNGENLGNAWIVDRLPIF